MSSIVTQISQLQVHTKTQHFPTLISVHSFTQVACKMLNRSKSLSKINRQMSNGKWSSSVDSAGDVKGLILYMKKASRLAPKFLGVLGTNNYKTMYATIPSSNPRRIEIYDDENEFRSGEPKRRLVFDSLLDFRDPSTVDKKNEGAVDLVVELYA